MRTYNYRLLDVFTDRPFGGNPLAVFTDAREMSDATMQSVARELNLSETTFVLPPKDPSHHYWVRIFTPLVELPTAGHPTIGTAFALALEERIRREKAQQRVVFEEASGPVSVTMDAPMITMSQALPTFGPRFHQREAAAALLGLDALSLVPNLPLECVSCGVPYLIVPVLDLEAMQRIRLRLDIWDRTLRRSPHPHVLAFTLQCTDPSSAAHCRMFAPGLGVPEDPATGSASGPLASYLLRYGLLPDRASHTLIFEQGVEIGRPSFIHTMVQVISGQISKLRIGGQCVAVGQGRIQLVV
jgi:trans-2,3-dihydro-3-hydroxyanthranilate isomerase